MMTVSAQYTNFGLSYLKRHTQAECCIPRETFPQVDCDVSLLRHSE